MSEPFRVIVIEDDPDVALFSKTVLEKRELCVVLTIADPRAVGAAVLDFVPDLVITDIELPGASGLELIGVIRELRPGIPVIVMTAHASLDYAVTALRSQADEFLTKPVTSADLVGHVTRLATKARESAASTPRNKLPRPREQNAGSKNGGTQIRCLDNRQTTGSIRSIPRLF